MANGNVGVVEKLTAIEQRIDRLESGLSQSLQTVLNNVKEALSGEISQINGNVVTLGNNVTTGVTREIAEVKRVLSEGFTEQRNKLAAIPGMQSAVTQAIVSSREAIAESIGGLKSYVEANAAEMDSKVESLNQAVQTAKTGVTDCLNEVERTLLDKDEEIITKCGELKTVADKVDESTRSLFVAYSNMVGEISRLATQAASDFAKDLLLANELRDAVQNCEEIIDIFNDLKGTYKTIAEIAAEGLKLFKSEGPMRQIFGKIEAAKDASFALSSLTNVFRAFKQESRESRFDF